MGGRVQRAKKTVEERIPALLVGPSHTMSCALHSVWYEGPLHEWTTFEQDATAEFQQHAWERHNSTITIRPVGQLGPHNIANVQLFIGDEKGLQGRFNQNVCHVMSAVFGSQGLNLRFGDFKSTNSTGRRIPDVVMMNQVHEVKVAGELKTQWVDQHNLNDDPLQNYDTEELFRKQIGQLHVFLKQELVAGHWSLRYSPIISGTMPHPSELTVRQCFFFLGKAAGRADQIVNQTPPTDWVHVQNR
ncbi:hypothetical protein N7472_010156 [Penicillium cf. griseofulvum]|uniref:Uncharacterized protein n=1 Tax=Penicillium cf. griseofulvum TaxID=2972120 RepID=A0A9W9IXF7_9EURO|nr:hypothetical protein N7472_010156 [Penicillium cf. griseofulvum]KAJ5436433.1 hypothetical protein N7445_007318 [Penicillium cf. griseofulvum]